MDLKINNDVQNELLERREISCTFSSVSEMMTRQDAIKIMAEKLSVDVNNIFLIRLKSITGTKNILGTFYIFDNPKNAQKQLPKYLFTRLLTKEEREKVIKGSKKGSKKSS